MTVEVAMDKFIRADKEALEVLRAAPPEQKLAALRNYLEQREREWRVLLDLARLEVTQAQEQVAMLERKRMLERKEKLN